MKRLDANLEIAKFLKENLTLENLQKADYAGTCDEFLSDYDNMIKALKEVPQYRWVQFLWLNGINLHGRGPEDRFYEESKETLNLLKT